MVKKLHINESFNFDNLDRFVGTDFYSFYMNIIMKSHSNSFKFIEYGDADGGDDGEVIFSIEDKKLRVVYEWVWDDDSSLFKKGYKSGKILYIDEL